jgi:Domain of unknown function (DUF3883)
VFFCLAKIETFQSLAAGKPWGRQTFAIHFIQIVNQRISNGCRTPKISLIIIKGGNLLTEPEADAEGEIAAAIEAALARSQGQGFARTPQERTAIEDHAMAAAMQYFKAERFVVEDVHLKRPYDLLCRRNEIELHVEVKGTTTNGDKVILTNNEVKHACDPGSTCVLFVLHSIILQGLRATGGKLVLLAPWELQQANLTPVCYTYRLR